MLRHHVHMHTMLRALTDRSPYSNETPWDLSMWHDMYVTLALVEGAEMPTEVSGRAFAAQGVVPGGSRLPNLVQADLRWGGRCAARLTCSFLCPGE